LTKVPLTYSVSIFNLGRLGALFGGLSSPKPPCSDGTDCRDNGQWFIVSYDSTNKQDHYKKPLHWANKPQ